MSLRLGSSEISKAYLGSEELDSLYGGDTKLLNLGTVSSIEASIDGQTISVLYSSNVVVAETLALLGSRAPIAATYASGLGSSAIVYTLNRTLFDDEVLLVSGQSFANEEATNGSAQTAPTAFRTFTKHGFVRTTGDNYWVDCPETAKSGQDIRHHLILRSADHLPGVGGIYCDCCLKTDDPTDPSNWKELAVGLSNGEFDYLDPADRPTATLIYSYTLEGTHSNETPCMDYETVGVHAGKWVLLSHATDIPELNDQATIIATGDWPWQVADYETAPGTALYLQDYAETSPGGNHTGYAQFYENPFPEYRLKDGSVPKWMGKSLFNSGPANNAYWGMDDFGSPEIVNTWKGSQFQEFDIAGEQRTSLMEWLGVTDLGNGEYVALTHVAGAGSFDVARNVTPWEVYYSNNGMTVTRRPVGEALSVGSPGATDEKEIVLSLRPIVLPDGRELWPYQGANNSAVNGLGLASCTLNHAATKPTIERRPLHHKLDVDFTSISSFPASIQSAGTEPSTFDSFNGLKMEGENPDYSGVEWATPYDPTVVTYRELNVFNITGRTPNAKRVFRLTDGLNMTVGEDSIIALTNTFGDSLLRIVEKKDNSLVEDYLDSGYWWAGRDDCDAHYRCEDGEYWTPNSGGMNERIRKGVVSDFSGAAFKLGFVTWDDVTWVERAIWRMTPYGSFAANTEPVVTAATTDAETITFALDRDCMGDMVGVAVKVDGSPVSGVWTRTDATTYVFHAATGTFVNGQTLTFDVSSCDVRSIADLVAIQDSVDLAISNTL